MHLKRLTVMAIGGASKGNPGPAAAGWVLWGRGDNGWTRVQSGGFFLGARTSMYAEAKACLLGVEALVRLMERKKAYLNRF